MGDGALANGHKLPRPSSTLPYSPFAAQQRFRQLCEAVLPCAQLSTGLAIAAWPWPAAAVVTSRRVSARRTRAIAVGATLGGRQTANGRHAFAGRPLHADAHTRWQAYTLQGLGWRGRRVVAGPRSAVRPWPCLRCP